MDMNKIKAAINAISQTIADDPKLDTFFTPTGEEQAKSEKEHGAGLVIGDRVFHMKVEEASMECHADVCARMQLSVSVSLPPSGTEKEEFHIVRVQMPVPRDMYAGPLKISTDRGDKFDVEVKSQQKCKEEFAEAVQKGEKAVLGTREGKGDVQKFEFNYPLDPERWTAVSIVFTLFSREPSCKNSTINFPLKFSQTPFNQGYVDKKTSDHQQDRSHASFGDLLDVTFHPGIGGTAYAVANDPAWYKVATTDAKMDDDIVMVEFDAVKQEDVGLQSYKVDLRKAQDSVVFCTGQLPQNRIFATASRESEALCFVGSFDNFPQPDEKPRLDVEFIDCSGSMHGQRMAWVRNFLEARYFPGGICDKSLLPVYMQRFESTCDESMGKFCRTEGDLRNFFSTLEAGGDTEFNTGLKFTINSARRLAGGGRGIQLNVYTDAAVAGKRDFNGLPDLLSGVTLRLVAIGTGNFPEAKEYCSFNPQSNHMAVSTDFSAVDVSRTAKFIGKPSVVVPTDVWLNCKTGGKFPARLEYSDDHAFVWGTLPNGVVPHDIVFTLTGLETPYTLPLIVQHMTCPRSAASINTAIIMAELMRKDISDAVKTEMAIQAKLVVPGLTGYICKVPTRAAPIHAVGNGDSGGAVGYDDDPCDDVGYEYDDDPCDAACYRSLGCGGKRSKVDEAKECVSSMISVIRNWLNNKSDVKDSFLSMHCFTEMAMASFNSKTSRLLIILDFIETHRSDLQLKESELDLFEAAKKKMSDISTLLASL